MYVLNITHDYICTNIENDVINIVVKHLHLSIPSNILFL